MTQSQLTDTTQTSSAPQPKVTPRTAVDLPAQVLPSLYIGHGAPMLLDDPIWSGELAQLATSMPKPTGILIVSAHWESAPMMMSAVSAGTPLVYDFSGFDSKYYQLQYQTPDAHQLAALVQSVLPDTQTITEQPNRGLDHGAYIPLMQMYPDADIPVVQISMPTHDPETLFALGKRFAILRQHGVLVVGSGFLTHGLPYLREFRIEATPPSWSVEFDQWVQDTISSRDIDALMNFQHLAPGLPFAHPTVEHFSPLFVALGAAQDDNAVPEVVIDGYWMGLAKTSFRIA